MIDLLSKINQDKIYKIFSKNIKSKNDLKRNMESLTNNILNEKDSYGPLLKGMFLLQEEIIPSNNFFSGAISGYLSIIDDYNAGTKSFIKRSIYDYDFKVYCSVELENIVSYEDKENINDEVIRILDSVDSEDEILTSFLGTYIENVDKNGNKNFAKEFLTINDELSQMLSTEKIFVYSALLNYSKTEIEKAEHYGEKLEIPNKWDQIRRIFIEFLENLGKRTINY